MGEAAWKSLTSGFGGGYGSLHQRLNDVSRIGDAVPSPRLQPMLGAHLSPAVVTTASLYTRGFPGGPSALNAWLLEVDLHANEQRLEARLLPFNGIEHAVPQRMERPLSIDSPLPSP